MGRSPNPSAPVHTIKIDHAIFSVMRHRASALNLTSTQYVSHLIKADAIRNQQSPLVIYPDGFTGESMEARVAKTLPSERPK